MLDRPLLRVLGGAALLPMLSRLRAPRITAAAALALGLVFASLSPAFAGQTITIDGRVNSDVWGNGTPPDGTPLVSLPDSATGNTVNVNSGGSVTGNVYGGNAFSDTGSGAATATGNSVIVNSGTVGGSVFGGYAYFPNGGATATGNSVTISGNAQVTGSVTGGWAKGYDDNNPAPGVAVASGNSVNISGNAQVSGDVTGGSASGGRTALPGVAVASGNSVTISGNAHVSGYITGGDADSGDTTAKAINNTVTISGSPSFDPVKTMILGGYTANGGDGFTGNTLNVWNYHGSPVWFVEGFQFFNFVFPATQSGPVLTVTGDALLGDGSRGSTVTAGALAAWCSSDAH